VELSVSGIEGVSLKGPYEPSGCISCLTTFGKHVMGLSDSSLFMLAAGLAPEAVFLR